MNRITEYFIVDGPDFPWGDYGSILLHGMSCHLGRSESGEIQLERTGPFIPPISFPGINDIVVTTPFRKKLEGSGLTGFEFRAVQKARIVEVNWHKWDRSAPVQRGIRRAESPKITFLERDIRTTSLQYWATFGRWCLKNVHK